MALSSRLLRLWLFLLPVATAACADFDLFDEKKTPLAGERRALFPTGIPGVNYNEPPQQPTNSNIPVNTQITGLKGQDNQTQESEQQSGAKVKSRTARAAKNQPPAQEATPADPWSDSRTAN